ncbi:DNA-binding protein [Colletotrichum karsti]|uniref:DNA-binding protein n=1 Tax=Colletotrichum karsti TaxID=1095194 RepID=A0A9P6LFL7_9PEZI|nr:DNA-binding protein [Colletotrichum karsti]KAF9870705.1 DNA-binding protein [Colletotrichum karsti]
MFSSISQRIFGTTPHKNSSPGPTRPPRDEPMRQPFPSTAPPGMQEAARDLDRQFSEVSETWGQADPDDDDDDDGNIPDGLPSEYDIKDDGDGDADGGDDDSDEYDDPFAGMAAFSTQIKPDEDDASTNGSDEDASAITKAEPEPSKKAEEKAPGRRIRQTARSEEQGSSAQTLPSPITSGRSNGSAAEEDSDASSSHRLVLKAEPPAPPVSNKKKRKRKSRSSQSASVEPEESTRAKKRKVRKPLEDIEDDDMDTQPEETVPDSPSNQIAAENSQSPGLDHDDFDHDLTLDLPTKPEPQQSQLVSVSRQLFQPTKGTSTGPTSVSEDAEQDDVINDDISDDDMGDANHEVSLSSPSVIAQRRRSMSRGSQISSFRQGLSRESTGLPDRISEAAESAEENESEGEDDQADPVVDAGGDVSMAETSALASGALRDDADQEDFADQLPPSSQPPREDSASVDGDAMDVDDRNEDADERSGSEESEQELDSDAATNELEEAQKAEAESDNDSDEEEDELVVEQPELPTRSTRKTRNGTVPTNGKATQAPVATTPRAASRRSRLDSHLINMSELSHVPSSAQKSARSTGSRRQRSKPNFFEAAEAYDHFDEEEKSEDENNQQDESDQYEETNQDEESDEEEENDEGSEEEVDEGTTVASSSGKKTYARNPASLRQSMRSTTTSPQKAAATSRASKSVAAKSTTPKSRASKPMPAGTPRSSAPSRAATASKGTTPLQRLARPTPLHTPSAHGEKMGRFDAEEHRRLDDLVQKYRKQKGWTQQKMNNVIQLRYRERQPDHGEDFNGQDFKDLWDFIVPHFPDRSGTKVRSVARGRYDNSQKRAGSWTREEDERIVELLDKYRGSSSQWVYIGEEMNRNPNHVRDRYRNYIVCGRNPDGVSTYQRWTEEEEEQLVECVMTVLRRMEPADPRRRPTKPMDYVNWSVVSDEMERKRSRLQCAKKWKQLNIELGEDDYHFPEDSNVSWFLKKARLQVREMSLEDRHELVKSILDLAPGTDEAIPWQKVVNNNFRQKWHRPTLKLLWFRLKQQVPGWAKKSVRDCARWLLEDAKKTTLAKSKILTGGTQERGIGAEEKAIRLSKKPEPKRPRRKATPTKKSPAKKTARSAAIVEESDTSEDEDVEGQDDETDNDEIRKKQPIKRLNRKAPPPKKAPRSAEIVEESDASEDEDANSQEDEETNGDNNETDAEESDAEESKESSDEEIEEPVDEEVEQEVEESEDADEDESQQNDDEDTQSGAAQKQSRGISEQAALQLSFAPSLSLGASQQVSTQPSPAKKRIRLSKGQTVNSRVSEGDFEEDGETLEVSPTQSQSQLDVRKIPDRKAEKRLAARQRVSSGSRARSTASAQPEYVPNDKIDKDMPPIRVPPSTQPSRFQAINRPPQGNFARRTGSSFLPGEPVELTDEMMAEFEAADRADDVTGSIVDSPIPSARRPRRRRKDAEVGETP